jgi:single-strand DNA-binding protein
MLMAFGQARVGRDVEVRNTQNGDPVANVSLAFNYGRKGDDNKYPTQWIEGVLWGNRAEGLAQYLTKGTTVSVTLEDVHVEYYDDKDGNQRDKLVGRITAIDLGARPQNDDSGGRQQGNDRSGNNSRGNGGNNRPQQRSNNSQGNQSRGNGNGNGGGGNNRPPPGRGFDDMDDDIPFASSSPTFDMESRHDRRVRRGDCR